MPPKSPAVGEVAGNPAHDHSIIELHRQPGTPGAIGGAEMNSPLVPDQVASLARAHVGIIAQRSAIWDGAVCDLIVKGPTGDHEVVVAPKVDTFFLTRSNDPHPIVRRLNGFGI